MKTTTSFQPLMKCGFKSLANSIKVVLVFLLLLGVNETGIAQCSHPSPSCNLSGPLKACVNGGDVFITTTIAFSSNPPGLAYTFPTNTSNASIVKRTFVSYSDSVYTETVEINAGNQAGSFNLELDVSVPYPGGCPTLTCECSKSMTILNTTASSSFAPIACTGGTTTLTVTGSGASSYSFTLQPSGPTNTTGVFPGLSAGTYSVTVAGTKVSLTCTTVNVTTIPPGSSTTPPTITETDNSGIANNDGIICLGATAGLSTGVFATYSWSTGATTSSITVSPSSNTTYSVTVSNGSTCTATGTTTITVNALPNASITETDQSGVAPNDGIICLGASAALNAGTWSKYSWSTGATTSSITVSPSSNTTYTVTVTNANGCTGSATSTITVNPPPTPTITETDISGVAANDKIICSGDPATLCTGSFDSYSWSNGATASCITVAPSFTTTYTVTVTNAGCPGTSTVSITVNAAATTTITETDNSGVAINDKIICVGASAVLNAGSFSSYSWNTGATTSSITVSPSVNTTYTVTVVNANGCSGIATATITVNPLPNPNITSVDNSGNPTDGIICLGGTAVLNPGPFGSYSWNTGSTTSTITVSPTVTTTYTVSVTDANGCVGTGTKTIVVNVFISVTITVTENSGLAANDGIICAGASAVLNAGSFNSYSWNTGATTSAITVTPSTNTTYSVTVNDANGCSGNAVFTITVNPNPNPTITETDNSGVASNDGIICAGAGAGLTTQVFSTYSWSTGATTSTITVSPSGNTTYTVTVSNAGCTGTATSTITVNQVPNVTITETDNSGVAANDGIICAGASAALNAGGPFGTYSWSTGATTSSITVSPLSNTTYTVTVTNAGCSSTATSTITVTPLPVPTITETDNSGVAANDDIICVGAGAGLNAGTFSTYSWSTGATTSGITVSPSSTTTYTVTVTNAGCSGTATNTITVNPLPTPTITETDNSGIAANDDIICAGASAGLNAGTFSTYAWSNGVTTSSITVAPSSTTTYTVTVTNAGCSATATNTITVTPLPVPTITETDNSGVAANDGIICIGAGAGLNAGTFSTYSWSTGATTSSITVSPSGNTTYTVTVSNQGCFGTATSTITVNQTPEVSITETDNSGVAANDNIICQGASAGLNAGGPFSSYFWNTGATTSAIVVSPSTTTTYTVTVFNAGCPGVATATITVTVLPNPVITETDQSGVAANDNIICIGASAGLNAGTFSSYFWNTGATTSAITVAPSINTTYTVTVSAAGCPGIATSTITVNPLPVPVITETDNSGVAANDDIICIGATAGLNAGTFSTYFWNTGATTSVISVAPSQTTTYSVTVTSAGCPGSATNTVTVNPLPVPVITETDNSGVAANDDIICAGASAALNAGSFSSYFWNTGSTASAITVSPSVTTTYSVTVFSAGCPGTTTNTVTVNPIPVPVITETDNSGVAPNDGIICVGATATLNTSSFGSYSWSNGATTQAITVTPSVTTTYTLTVTNAGCPGSTTFTVTVNPIPNPSITETDNSGVANNDGIICAGATAGLNTGVFSTYSWSTGATTQTITVTPGSTTTYTVTVTNAGCSGSTSTTVTVNPIPNATITETDNSGQFPNDKIVCSGDQAGLCVNGVFNSYSWSTGATTSCITVTPSSTTTYTVTVSNAGCPGTATVTITVNPLPNPTITETDQSGILPNDKIICSGDQAGLCVGSFNSYSWSNGATTSCITVSPTSTTTYTVLVTNAGCSATSTVSITVNSVSTVTITETDNSGTPNDGVVCTGGSATLSAGSFSTYSWSNAATASSITVTPASTTTYTVTVTNAGCSASATTTITVVTCGTPSITLTKTPDVCQFQEGVSTTVNYRYVVTNASTNGASASGTIVDDNGTPGNTSDDVTICSWGPIVPGDSAVCTHAFTITATHTNIATATGTAGGAPVTAAATATVVGVNCNCNLTYPDSSNLPRSGVAFNESGCLAASDPGPMTCGNSSSVIKLWYTDEHALTLGVRAVVIKAKRNGTTVTYTVSPSSFSITPTPPAPTCVTGPSVGDTISSGSLAGNDVAAGGGRPLWPSLFITDLTANPSNPRAGDWQQGGVGIPPTKVCGTWKAAVRIVDSTTTTPTITVTPDADPAQNTWAGIPDAPPGGFSTISNLGYGAECAWDIPTLTAAGLIIPGHLYRLQFMVHDGDQNKSGGDVGESCTTIQIPSGNCTVTTPPPPPCNNPSSIAANFNGTSIASGSYIWFSSVVKVSGKSVTYPLTIQFISQNIVSSAFNLSPPLGKLVLDPTVTSATTSFDGTQWVTTAPPNLSGNYFLSGYTYLVPSAIAANLKPVTWTGSFMTTDANAQIQWQWAAAVYKTFSSNLSSLGIKATDASYTPNLNGDKAGTPENFKNTSYLTGGALGGGGNNWTGSNTGQATPTPCITSPRLSGSPSHNDGEFSVITYPNPFGGSINIEFITPFEGAADIRLFDVTGRLVESFRETSGKINTGQNLGAGVYFITFTQGDQYKTVRIIKTEQ